MLGEVSSANGSFVNELIETLVIVAGTGSPGSATLLRSPGRRCEVAHTASRFSFTWAGQDARRGMLAWVDTIEAQSGDPLLCVDGATARLQGELSAGRSDRYVDCGHGDSARVTLPPPRLWFIGGPRQA